MQDAIDHTEKRSNTMNGAHPAIHEGNTLFLKGLTMRREKIIAADSQLEVADNVLLLATDNLMSSGCRDIGFDVQSLRHQISVLRQKIKKLST